LFENDPALSPEIAPGIVAPVFLIHGTDDNVVPSIESRLLAERLQRQVPVHLLITPLITHAEVDRDAGVVDIWRLIRFWYALLNS
jgi:dipeptidyl aminopeptidase/acylaminoacyl peptidase